MTKVKAIITALLLVNALLASAVLETSWSLNDLRNEISVLRTETANSRYENPESDPTVGSIPRSEHWPEVRAKHLRVYPDCAACGVTEGVEVHHVIPFSHDPSKELELSNLITLCRSGANHHFYIGHDPDGPDGPQKPNWSAANKNVRIDAARLRRKLKPESTR